MSSDHRKRVVHVAGVAGVGMNAVAQVLLGQGWRVTGSDRFLDQGKRLPVLDQLEALGVDLFAQDGSGVSAETDALVISTAVEADNPDRLRAAELGVREQHRSDVLVAAAGQGCGVAIAGTSGKTTCTAMLGWWLEQAGADPNVVNGGALVNWRSPQRIGNVRLADPSGFWVVEADESDKSLLRFSPDFALVTTITADHFALEESICLFRDFAARVRRKIVCGPGVKTLLAGSTAAELMEVQALPQPTLTLPGAHNHLNASMVETLAGAMGVQASGDWSAFRGVERRLERHSTLDAAVQVFDDYGHNPEKIAAALQAVRPADGRLFAVWRPHGFAPLFNNLDAFAACFTDHLRAADRAVILPVFFAGGTADRSRDSHELAARIPDAVTVPDFEAAERWLRTQLRPGDVVLSMGARDPELPDFARRVAGM